MMRWISVSQCYHLRCIVDVDIPVWPANINLSNPDRQQKQVTKNWSLENVPCLNGPLVLILQSYCQQLRVSWAPRADWSCVAASLCACLSLLLLVFVQQRCVTLFSSSQSSTSPLLIKKTFAQSLSECNPGRNMDACEQGLHLLEICSFVSSIIRPFIRLIAFYITPVSIRWTLVKFWYFQCFVLFFCMHGRFCSFDSQTVNF